MLRPILCTPFLALYLGGCFSEPPGAGSDSSASTGEATSTGGSTSSPTDPSVPTTTGQGTTTSSGTSDGSSSETGATSGSTSAATTSTTGEPSEPCGCPDGPLLFCEMFETFDAGTFEGWGVPMIATSAPPQAVDGECGQAFRGEIIAGQSFSVIARQQLDILSQAETDAFRLRGWMRVESGCAAVTPHRLVLTRADEPESMFRYSAEIELEAGTFHLIQRSPTASAITSELGPLVADTWVPFEISLLGLQPGGEPMVQARVGEDWVNEPRLALNVPELSVAAIPGPFAYIDKRSAGCTVDFDDISVELLGPTP